MYEIKLAIIDLSQWLYPWLKEISMAIMATLLVIYGSTVNRMVKRQINGMHFVFRSLIFIILCAFGYGALLIFATPYLTKGLAMVGMVYLSPLILGIFITLGVIAEKKNQI
jgi:hypothetical protein